MSKKRKREESDQESEENESTKKLALDSIPLRNEEAIELPSPIKAQIKNSVAELKQLLKNDNEFCVELIKSIVNVGEYIWPQTIDSKVFSHYDSIIKQCTKEHQPWPIQVTRVRNIASLLAHLVSGYDPLIFDELKGNEPHTMHKKCEDLGKLCGVEIGIQFNPEVDYHHVLSPEAIHMYEVLMSGDWVDGEDL